MKSKRSDCVEMKRQGAAWIHEPVRDLPEDQKIGHRRRRSEDLRREQREILRRHESSSRG